MASILTTIQSKLGYSTQKALLLGAGFVTKPTIQILSDAGVEVIVGEFQNDVDIDYKPRHQDLVDLT